MRRGRSPRISTVARARERLAIVARSSGVSGGTTSGVDGSYRGFGSSAFSATVKSSQYRSDGKYACKQWMRMRSTPSRTVELDRHFLPRLLYEDGRGDAKGVRQVVGLRAPLVLVDHKVHTAAHGLDRVDPRRDAVGLSGGDGNELADERRVSGRRQFA